MSDTAKGSVSRVLAGSRPSGRVTASAPIILVRNVRNSVSFFTTVLGFEIRQQNADWSAAPVARQGARFLLIHLENFGALRATEQHFSAYLWVDHVDGLYNA